MRNIIFDEKHNQWIADRNEAFLSLDRAKILAYSKKYNSDDGYEQEDEYVFWISVHKARTAIISLPETERLKSIWWLMERGFEHYASDIVEKYGSLASLDKLVYSH